MRLLFSALLCCALAAAGPVGCGKSTTGGEKHSTPGASGSGNVTVDKTFKMTVTDKTINIKQGDSADTSISFSFGKDFDGKLKVKLDPGKGLSVDPKTKDLTHSDKELKLTITADKTAAEGDADVSVTATPESGKAVESKIAVKVKKS